MGWNSWNKFNCDVSEQLIRHMTDVVVEKGLDRLGYKYINIDDCWQAHQRDSQGMIVADPIRFPSGMKVLADYVHSKGLLFGLYSDSGEATCAGYPGSRHYEEKDAAYYAANEVDYLKYDNCHVLPEEVHQVQDRFNDMHKALNSSGRHIYYSLCEWGSASPWEWGSAIANSWRTDDDISDNYDSMLRCIDNVVGLSQYAGPGLGWNDPDMLEVGNGGMQVREYRAHFALWCIVKAPLMLGNDLGNMKQEIEDIIAADEVIAINQDELGIAGDLVWKDGPSEVYATILSDGSRAVVLFNRRTLYDPEPAMFDVQLAMLFDQEDVEVQVRDLYAKRDLASARGVLTIPVPTHDVLVLKLTPTSHTFRTSQHNMQWRPWHTQTAQYYHQQRMQRAQQASVIAIQ